MVKVFLDRRLLSTLFVLFISCLFVSAQTKNKLSGRVTDTDGNAVEIAFVVLNNALSTMTDEKGEFTFPNVPAGEISYRVTCLGYQEVNGTFKHTTSGKERLNVKMKSLSLDLDEVTVTAQQQSMGSKSMIGQDAVRHIQPKSLSDMLQLLPGGLTKNPTLNNLAQANIREIGGNDNNAAGTAIILDGTPLSNDANLQAIAPTLSGNSSSTSSDGMSGQTTAGRGADLRTISADNIESVEVIRGIPSVEYGNLTSGVVVVKTKAGKSPLEVKFKADPFSKMAYAGKGFALGTGTMNVGVDWSQSWGDTRKHYMGYDRVTGSIGYSNVFNQGSERPITFNVNASFYNNVNNQKHDPQMDQLELSYKNKNTGGRLAMHGKFLLNSWLTAVDYDFSASLSRTVDTHHDRIANPDGVISDAMTSGEHQALLLEKAYFSDYQLEGIPLNLFGQVRANKYFQIGDFNYTNLKAGVEYRLDDNNGKGLTFDLAAPPKASGAQSYRPRSYKDIPAMQNLSFFLNDVSKFELGTTDLEFDAGVRFSNLILNKDKAKRNSIFVAEPRVNAEYSFLTTRNNDIFDKLSISGGFGISNKMPSLLYLYPDNAYFDNVSASAIATDASRVAVMTTRVVDDTQSTNLKPARSTKWELGLNARIGKMKGYVNFFREAHRNELGYNSQFVLLNYNKYLIANNATNLAYQNGQVTYDVNGVQQVASSTPQTEMKFWAKPSNTTRTDKWGLEYSWDFGTWKPLRTSLVMDGAWFHIKRKTDVSSLNYISYTYDYMPVMPAGDGTISDRINTNFRFITHIPSVDLIFTTTVQVVWYESERSIYENESGKERYHLSADGTRYIVSPLGFYDRQGNWNEWQPSYETNQEYQLMNDQYLTYSFKSDKIDPWAMINFRLTKELGRHAEISFMANNFLNIKRYHTDRNTGSMTQLYPDMYFGAEAKLKF